MKNIIMLLLIIVFFFPGLPQNQNREINVKRSCCTDSGGIWKNNNCQVSDYFDKENYNNCINYSN